ncbi:diguanylate cyclase [Treponema sp. OMZ 799]|uniref:ligand-binding sensor domain-containing protein n=1 Tax=Treponema sp. OMZ 799 TaxID=2563668 RepID=UPI0021FE66CC|nr:diguanylate cyclase [Treponema sp. OMZ 799]
MHKKVILFFLILFTFNLFADEDVFVFYSQPSSIASKFVTGISQDSHGRLWFGTKEGLGFYDGIKYKNYEYIPFSKDSIQSSQIQSLYRDPIKAKNGSDVFWLGTFDGVERFNVDTETFTHFDMTNSIVFGFLRDSHGRLWVGSLDGLYILNEDDGSVIEFSQTAEFYIGNNGIADIYEDSEGRIYACTHGGLWEYDEPNKRFKPSRLFGNDSSLMESLVHNILEEDGIYWVSVWNTGLFRIDPKNGKRELFSFSNNKISCLSNKFSDDVLLIGTWGGGLISFDKNTYSYTEYTSKQRSYNLSNDFIFSIHVDSYGSLWVGTNGGGVNIYDTKRMWSKLILLHENKVTGRENSVFDLSKDKKGNLWISLLNNGITYYDVNTGKKKHYRYSESKIISNSVFKFYIDKNEDIWVGTDIGLCKYDKKKDAFVGVNLYNDNIIEDGERIIYSITSDDKGLLWIGTYDGGLIKFSPSSGILKRYKNDPKNPNSLCSNLIFSLLIDSSKKLWAGTNKGLAEYRPSSDDFIIYRYDVNNRDGISSDRITSLFQDVSGKLWIGTSDGGINIFDAEKKMILNYTSTDGLPANFITGITDMDNNSICVTAIKGMTIFNRNSEIIYSYTFYNHERRFTTVPVTIGNECFVGTQEGVLGVDINYLLSFKKQEVPVKIRTIGINGNQTPAFKIDLQKASKYKYSENNISFEFSSMDLSPLSRPSYVFMLEGFDKNWINANMKNYVQYTNLKSGKYTFKVKDISNPYPEPTSFTFIIEKPFWLSMPMIAAYILICSGLAFLACRLRQLFQYKVVNKKLQEEQKDLISANEQLTVLSTVDELTGVGNRRQLDTVGKDFWRKGLDNKQQISLIMIDIDLFKQYNDLYGHPAGDNVLRSVAQTLQKNLRAKYDFLGRYGGEEFLILLYNSSAAETMKIAEKLRIEVKNLKIEHSAAKDKVLTISLGAYASIPANELSYETMLSFADAALYKAKESGRDICKMYTE